MGETISMILSIIASLGTIFSLILSFRLKNELRTMNKISGIRNIQSPGVNNVNNTGDGNTFYKK